MPRFDLVVGCLYSFGPKISHFDVTAQNGRKKRRNKSIRESKIYLKNYFFFQNNIVNNTSRSRQSYMYFR